ncbi:hypothetical protein Ddye_032354 [Dipteronia dyeriana]|uniref:Uncharacterized protein n=1 Tax=Dipteronia dyeriana TaxID=168575 RepID=A0AAD9WPC0_9ROSI|nr:hypothetical protein Ddye_032354 [Dipteronia dyeriana]
MGLGVNWLAAAVALLLWLSWLLLRKRGTPPSKRSVRNGSTLGLEDPRNLMDLMSHIDLRGLPLFRLFLLPFCWSTKQGWRRCKISRVFWFVLVVNHLLRIRYSLRTVLKFSKEVHHLEIFIYRTAMMEFYACDEFVVGYLRFYWTKGKEGYRIIMDSGLILYVLDVFRCISRVQFYDNFSRVIFESPVTEFQSWITEVIPLYSICRNIDSDSDSTISRGLETFYRFAADLIAGEWGARRCYWMVMKPRRLHSGKPSTMYSDTKDEKPNEHDYPSSSDDTFIGVEQGTGVQDGIRGTKNYGDPGGVTFGGPSHDHFPTILSCWILPCVGQYSFRTTPIASTSQERPLFMG